ncbi:type II toxin-antitoxin system VapC family toxin [Brevundimonas intermedia]|uniref:type II toxin-antitoxin system VapC family toxin n=1 Tax=Brevundimonas intermedia TaxID=74315 RepID=UPI00320A1DF1
MIVVDASALVAVLLDEPEKLQILTILATEEAMLSPIGYWEAHTRIHGLRGDDGVADLDALLTNFGIRITPATAITAKFAAQAQIDFGKRTPAKLNLGDCFAYALAKESDAPLLFKGDDFSQTDLIPALSA